MFNELVNISVDYLVDDRVM